MWRRYLALSYGYTKDGSGKDRHTAVRSPEDDEFDQCDLWLLESAATAGGDAAKHIRQVSGSDDFVVFERKVGSMLHRFRSKFVASASDPAVMVPHQYTEILAPSHFQKGLIFPLNKDLGEAGCMFQSEIVLCNFMSDESCALSKYMKGDQKIVELGCGTGLLGIVIAQMGQKILLTDMPHVLPQIEHNVKENLEGEAAARCSVSPLTWGNEEHGEAAGKFDLVLCSDLVYKEETKEPLVKTLRALTHPGSIVAMAFERRRKNVEDSFMDLCAEHFGEWQIPSNYCGHVCMQYLGSRSPCP